MLGAVVAALACVIVLTAPDGAAAHEYEVLPQAMSGVSAAAGQLSAVPYAGAAAGVAPLTTATSTTPLVPTLTTTPPPVTTTTPSPTTTTKPPTTPPPVTLTFPHQPIPTFPSGCIHHHRRFC
jgi:hypothetical protein